jgi:hypothetical protein
VRFSGILSDDLGQLIGAILKGQEGQEDYLLINCTFSFIISFQTLLGISAPLSGSLVF